MIRGRGHVTIQQLSADTALHPHDIALAFMLLGFIRKSVDNKFILAIDWTKVDSHMEKVKKALRIQIDPDALRWVPTPPAGIMFDSPLKSEPSGGESSDSEDEKKKNDEKDFEIKIGSQKQAMSTESESECALSGEYVGLDGGASIPSNRRKFSRMNRSVVVTPSGDSADGELSEDDRYTGSSGDRTPTSSKKLHKKSPKKSFSSSFGRRKAKERGEKLTKKNLKTVDSSEASENESYDDSDDQLKSRGSRQAAKQATNAISKTISKIDKRSDQEESSSSGSDEDDDAKDLNLRKREKSNKEHRSEKRQSNHESSKRRSEEHMKIKSPHKSKPSHRSNSISENSDFVMPELEPQVMPTLSRNPVPQVKDSDSPKSSKKSKSKKDERRHQKSIKEFFSKKSNFDNVSSASSQEDEKAPKPEPKMEKVQKHAIERSFEANKGFLTSFESFQSNDSPKNSKEVKSPKVREERKEKQRERDEILRKERHERKKKEREERKRLEREEKERLEKEKENLRVKEQMLIEKRKQKEEEKEKVEFENKVPLPISSPKKIGKSPEINHKSYQSPENCQNTKSSPEKECSDMNDVKTPKKLRKWPPENESPDPKKNFIKKHQEEQEKLHQETIQNSPNNSGTSPCKDNPPKTQPEPTPRSSENSENSLWENLGYNSGDDVSRYSDDHLNKQLIVKPNTVLAKDGSEDDENILKPDELPKQTEELSKVQENESKSDQNLNIEESKVVEQVACLEQQKMPDCMVEQQKQALEQQQQQHQHQASQQQPLGQ